MNMHALPSRLPAGRTTFGAIEVDRRLGGGITTAALHEIYGDADDAGAVTGFSLLLALRAAMARPIIIIRDDRSVRAGGRIYGDGVAALGADPAMITLVHSVGTLPTLRAADDAVACPVVGAVIVEPWRAATEFDLTSSRRIALRAARSGVFALIVRLGVAPTPSAAATRWRVRGAPSTALAANAPGPPAFDIALLRHRGGVAGFVTRVEWNRDDRNFRDAPLSRGVPAVAVGGTRDPRERRAA
jgi:protein ImuA